MATYPSTTYSGLVIGRVSSKNRIFEYDIRPVTEYRTWLPDSWTNNWLDAGKVSGRPDIDSNIRLDTACKKAGYPVHSIVGFIVSCVSWFLY